MPVERIDFWEIDSIYLFYILAGMSMVIFFSASISVHMYGLLQLIEKR